MDFQISTLCDYAADYQGKLCVQGAFDTLFARQFPVTHPSCALALRVCLVPEDAGSHKLTISIVNEDGKTILPEDKPIEGDLQVSLPENAPFFTRNLIMNFQGLQFPAAGTYAIEVLLDGNVEAKIPLNVVLIPEQAQQ